jgi:hypothetical protein
MTFLGGVTGSTSTHFQLELMKNISSTHCVKQQ